MTSYSSSAAFYPTAAASQPKPVLKEYRTFEHHRSGWAYALDALKPLMKDDGVLLDSAL